MMTSEVKEIRIDDLPCKSFQRRIDEWKRYGARSELSKRNRLVSRKSGNGVGIKPEALIHGWRELESRSHQLKKIVYDIQDAHWHALRAASAASVAAGCNGDVWIPEPDGKHVDVFDSKREQRSGRSHAELVKECIGNPDMTALVLSGESLAQMRRLKERERTWRTRYWAYHGAFVLAIEERLREFVDTQAQHYPVIGRKIAPPCAFLFGNEGRQYLVCKAQESYEFTWFGGTLFHDSPLGSL